MREETAGKARAGMVTGLENCEKLWSPSPKPGWLLSTPTQAARAGAGEGKLQGGAQEPLDLMAGGEERVGWGVECSGSSWSCN